MKLYKEIDKSVSNHIVIAIISSVLFSTGVLIHQLSKLFFYYIVPHLTLKDVLPMLTALTSLLFISTDDKTIKTYRCQMKDCDKEYDFN